MHYLRRRQDFVESLSQDVDGRGLEEDAADSDGRGLLFVFRADVAGGEDDRNVGTDGEKLAGDLEAGNPGHGEVGDDGCEAIGIRPKFGDSGDSVHVTGNAVAEPLEEARTEHDERFFVVDQEHAFVVSGFVGRLRNLRSGGGS